MLVLECRSGEIPIASKEERFGVDGERKEASWLHHGQIDEGEVL